MWEGVCVFVSKKVTPEIRRIFFGWADRPIPFMWDKGKRGGPADTQTDQKNLHRTRHKTR